MENAGVDVGALALASPPLTLLPVSGVRGWLGGGGDMQQKNNEATRMVTAEDDRPPTRAPARAFFVASPPTPPGRQIAGVLKSG